MKGRKTGGRTKGTPNKATTAFKAAVLRIYDAIGGDTRFAGWAEENPTEFYRIASRLIPTEMHATHSGSVSMPTSVVFELHEESS